MDSRTRAGRARRGAAVVLTLVVCASFACAGPRGRRPPARRAPAPTMERPEPLPGPAAPFRMTDLASRGDAARRASVRIVLEGLDADATGDVSAAVRLYQRALQVDPGNPYAYLALGRSWLERGDARRALSYVDQADSLLGSQRARDDSVDAITLGLRGAALEALGRSREAAPLEDRARALAPGIWSDGRLDAQELR